MRTDVLQSEVREAQLLIGGQWTRGVDTFAVLDKFSGATIAALRARIARSKSTRQSPLHGVPSKRSVSPPTSATRS